jgi:hypothetical protein
MTPSTPQSSISRRRRAITDLERRNIRRRYTEHPGQQVHIASWFEQQTGHRLGQGQISTILSDKYAYLDNDSRKPSELGSKRNYDGDYPELEAALFEWQQRMQQKKAVITGDILKAKASELWNRLPQFKHSIEPKWSNGWLDGFKKRFKIREFVQHGEGGSADIDNPDAIQQMADLRTICSKYKDKDIFNMDETGLFWKLTPERTLATKAGSGGKKSKDRITLALTTNADGSEKLEPWVIGKSKNPRCFKGINRQYLRIQYRYNKTKWMTGLVIEEYLRWLDNKMHGRKILLLLDNFSGHELGVQLVGGLDGLQNVRICWLPANTTSHWQPLDQGIIASFKLQYRRQWVAYMLRQHEAGKDPNKTVTLLKAVQWTRVSWAQYLASSTIQKCFWKSTLISKPQGMTEQNTDQEDIDDLAAQISSLPGIQDLMPVREFIAVPEEVIADNDDDIMASVVDMYSVDEVGEVSEPEEDDIEALKISRKEALQALEVLKLYTIQQDDIDGSILPSLDKLGWFVTQKRVQESRQSSILSFFQPK